MHFAALIVSSLLMVYNVGGEVNVTRLSEVLTTLARQTMMQQLEIEERIRSDGCSGVKQARSSKSGTRAYMSSTHVSHSTASMHDHANHYNTMGIGEFVGVMNGLEFRTRHNDYMLVQPSREDKSYKAVDVIEYPDVPPEVLEKDSLDDQIKEMREWFKAWADQDSSERDYTKYFKALLCYMEGMWTEADFGEVEEPFESDRHHVSAENWYDLQEKIRFTSYTGGKEKGENYAFLPTKIMDINKQTGEPIYAQWNYRILCHQLKEDVPLDYFQPTGDLHKRMTLRMRFLEFSNSRSERFFFNNKPGVLERTYRWDYLESLMNQIPGLDNYKADIVDASFGQKAMDPFTDEVKNAGFYHSWYKFQFADAMGQGQGRRGFSDQNLFVAFNNQPHVLGKSVRWCENQECDTSVARVSYAIPMEIVYLTPLHNWNPYDIKFWPKEKQNEVKSGKRKGLFEKDTAFNGNSAQNFYRTPAEFFNGDEVDADEADTAAAVAGVLDQDGNVRNVIASGMRIFLPTIPGIPGNLRTRFPIFPIHDEGSTTFKEALREILMDMERHAAMFKVLPTFSAGDEEDEDTTEDIVKTLYTSMSDSSNAAEHRHTVGLTNLQLAQITINKKSLTFSTSTDEKHNHVVKIKYDKDTKKFLLSRCDGKKSCWDGHEMDLFEEDPEE